MKAFTKILAGGVGLAALAAAAPAAAQYYPGYPGGGYGGYGGYGQGGVVGQILDSILGGQRYGGNDRYQIDVCVRATEARLNGYGNNRYGYDPRYGGGYGGYGGGYGGYGGGYGGGYDPRYGGGYGYGQGGYGYGGGYGNARVVRITHVERRSNGGLKVYGLADAGRTGRYGNYGYDPRYGGYGGYNNYGYGAEYRFNCKVDYRGRVTDVDLDRNNNYSRRYR